MTPQITFSLCKWISFIWFGQKLSWTYYLTPQTIFWKNFRFFSKSKMAARGQRLKITKFDPTNQYFGSAYRFCSSDLDKIWHGHTYWLHKQVCERIFDFFQNPRWLPGFKGQKLTKFDPTNHISARHTDSVHPIWTKFGTDILIDSTNKFVKEFLIFSKIQDGCRGSKVKN